MSFSYWCVTKTSLDNDCDTNKNCQPTTFLFGHHSLHLGHCPRPSTPAPQCERLDRHSCVLYCPATASRGARGQRLRVLCVTSHCARYPLHFLDHATHLSASVTCHFLSVCKELFLLPQFPELLINLSYFRKKFIAYTFFWYKKIEQTHFTLSFTDVWEVDRNSDTWCYNTGLPSGATKDR